MQSVVDFRDRHDHLRHFALESVGLDYYGRPELGSLEIRVGKQDQNDIPTVTCCC